MPRPSARSPDEVILLTGASTGLGLAVSRRLLADTAYRLVLTARPRSMGRFADAGIVEGPRVMLRPLDVTDEEARHEVVDEVNDRWGAVDVLINNAGIAYRSVVEHVNEIERIEQIHVNFRAPIALAALVLPGMRARRRGRILNISSVGGMMAMPTMAIYSASKFALEGASEALWYEVRPWGIHVSLIEPGFVNSESFERTLYTIASRVSADDHFDPYHAHYLSMTGFIDRIMRFTWATPDAVARTVLRVIRARNPALRVPATLDAHLFALFRRLVPQAIYHALLYRLLPRIDTWGPAWEAMATTEPIPSEDDPTIEMAPHPADADPTEEIAPLPPRA
jgi:short-subunit dehydrogenase